MPFARAKVVLLAAFVAVASASRAQASERVSLQWNAPEGCPLRAEVLAEVGIDRRLVYVTNAVKHFKFEPRGKRRIHKKPAMPEIRACSAWLRAEVEAIGPRMILCLGASAAQSFMGPGFRLLARRGEVLTDTPWAPWWMATYHPSALLRMPDEAARAEARRAFGADLRRVAEEMGAATS